MKKIKIAHFISSLEQGGAQRILADLIARLDHYEHHVMYIHGGSYEQWYAQRGISLYRVRGFFHHYDPFLYVSIFHTLRSISPDMLHTSLWAANWAGRIVGTMLSIPTVMTLHNRAELNGKIRMLFDAIAPRAQSVVAVSDEVKKTFQAIYRAPIQVIYNGVASLPTKNCRAQLGLSDEHFVIGAVGRLHRIKRFDLLVRSFGIIAARYPEVRLVIIGSGSQNDLIEQQIMNHGLSERVRIIKGHNARDYYGSFDCFVLSSAQEGISIALLEAMSAGRACVVTHDELTHPVITAGYDGLLCAGSDYALASMIDQIVRDSVQRAALGIQARKTVAERFSIERMTNAYDKLFLSLICPQNTNPI